MGVLFSIIGFILGFLLSYKALKNEHKAIQIIPSIGIGFIGFLVLGVVGVSISGDSEEEASRIVKNPQPVVIKSESKPLQHWPSTRAACAAFDGTPLQTYGVTMNMESDYSGCHSDLKLSPGEPLNQSAITYSVSGTFSDIYPTTITLRLRQQGTQQQNSNLETLTGAYAKLITETLGNYYPALSPEVINKLKNMQTFSQEIYAHSMQTEVKHSGKISYYKIIFTRSH